MTFSAVLLVGGESRRMNRDKALLSCFGRPLWELQIARLKKLKPTKIFVSARLDPSWRPVDLEFVGDAPPSRGPLSGLAACLARVETDHLLAMAVDLPLMNETFLRRMCGKAISTRGVVPIIENRFEPLAAIYPKKTVPQCRDALRSEDFSLQSLLQRLVKDGTMLPFPVTREEETFFRNVNAPADLLDPPGRHRFTPDR